MSLAIIDASVLVAFYAADDPRHDRVAERLTAGDALFAPAHLDTEIVSAMRGIARNNPRVEALVPSAITHLTDFPIRRVPLASLLVRMWELRHNVTPYDAAYIALAERLDAVLITCDARLVAASGPTCNFDQIE